MKTVLVIIALMTNANVERSETVYLESGTLSVLVDCQTAAEHLNQIAKDKSASTWAYCVQLPVTQ
jgi:hypothetical protein